MHIIPFFSLIRSLFHSHSLYFISQLPKTDQFIPFSCSFCSYFSRVFFRFFLSSGTNQPLMWYNPYFGKYCGDIPCATVCGNNEFISGMSGDGCVDTMTCAPCSPPNSCPSGQYESSSCVSTADRQCKQCTVCHRPHQYTVSNCTASTDTVCAACNTGDCPVGKYQTAACTATADLVCSPCPTYSGPCAAGFFESSHCNATTDRKCSACPVNSGACPSGTVESYSCSASEDRQCTSCAHLFQLEYFNAKLPECSCAAGDVNCIVSQSLYGQQELDLRSRLSQIPIFAQGLCGG